MTTVGENVQKLVAEAISRVFQEEFMEKVIVATLIKDCERCKGTGEVDVNGITVYCAGCLGTKRCVTKAGTELLRFLQKYQSNSRIL